MFIWLARFLVCPGIDLESCAGYSLSLLILTQLHPSYLTQHITREQ